METVRFTILGGILATTLIGTVGCGTPLTSTESRNNTLPPNGMSQSTNQTTSHTSLTTEQLSFQVRDKLLRQMSNPSQGEDCMNSPSCSVIGTRFSGPSVTNQNVSLDMIYMKYNDWYIIVAPTTKNAFTVAQSIIHASLNFPYQTGVMVLHSKDKDYYWIKNSKEYSKSEELS